MLGEFAGLPDHGSVDGLPVVAAFEAAVVLGASDPRISKDGRTRRRIASHRRRKRFAAGAAYEAARGDKSARARTARTCRNNVAERALRPAVIWRRTSLGRQSALGSQFVARMPVTFTLRSQQRPVLEYLTAACEAARQGMPAPSLRPDPAL